MNESLIVASSTISLLGIWYAMTTLLREYRVEKFRQEAFALRDALFDEAASGRISFDHPAYGLTRNLMNGFIRSAHRISLLHFVATEVFVQAPPTEQSFSGRLDQAISTLSSDQKKLYDDYHTKMSVLVVKQLMWGSPLLLVPAAILLIIGFHLENLVQALKRQVAGIDNVAIACGEAALVRP